MKKTLFLCCLAFFALGIQARTTYNFNLDWCYKVGDVANAQQWNFPDENWEKISLPHAFNETEAFKLAIHELTDTVVWYRKHFKLPKGSGEKKVFIEFEGVRQAADFYVNGQWIGRHENGVMAVGFDITSYVDTQDDNVIAVRVDNNWKYREHDTESTFQWNNNNFNVNYGGIPKNVSLHLTEKIYQTLPLYSQLKTTGVYVYAVDIRVPERKAVVFVESQVKNETSYNSDVTLQVTVYDADNNEVAKFNGEVTPMKWGETTILKASQTLENLHFWSWGYGYLYTVKTQVLSRGKVVDEVITRTGFRKTHFGEGKIWLNDRVLMIHGFAQRTSNEWPAIGISLPPWLSDYSNDLMVKGNGNAVRWMHVTPSKQDVESCDRVGLIQAMPAGDAEKDAKGRQWEQRKELMRDAIIYNRNNPSILFYECGNESISKEHMQEMQDIRDEYDPFGGRAIGSREMLDIDNAEYGGEMLYINKSAKHPMWAMEYCRDEGLRKYWDDKSYPYHKEGDGPLYRNQDASDYNHNQDRFAVEHIRRWYDYWRERPGTGKRVSSGGVKIIFSDTNTHFRGAENYRRSGVVDALRIPKDSYFAHQVMWNGWVDIEQEQTHIMGHWNYKKDTVKTVYVTSTADKVELLLNGKSLGYGKQDYRFLFTFPQVTFEAGELIAIGYDAAGKETSRHALKSAGEPHALRLSFVGKDAGFFADGADVALVEVEVVDAEGQRCPLDNRKVTFELDGAAEWRGGMAQGENNFILSKVLPVECGVNRVLIRTTRDAGKVTLTASADGLATQQLTFKTSSVKVKNGLTQFSPAQELPLHLERGETPASPSYKECRTALTIVSAEAGCNSEEAVKSYDDNELSEWKNDGQLQTAWITYRFEHADSIHDICLKLTGWRMRSYPLEVYAGDKLIYSGETDKSLGYIHLPVAPLFTDEITFRLKGSITEKDAFGQVVELVQPEGGELDLFKAKEGSKTKNELRIVEVEFLKNL